MTLRPVALLAAALTAGSLAAAVPASGAPTAAPARAGSPGAARHAHHAPRPSRALHARLAAAAASVPHAPTTRAATRLDPATRSLPTVRGGRVGVTVDGDAATVAGAVRRLGGTVLTSAAGASSVLVPKSRLAALSAAGGVAAVRAPVKAFPLDVPTSEGVQASGADDWHGASTDGAGVSVAVVDDGFTDVPAQIQNHVLPATTVVMNEGCTDSTGKPSTDTDQHGTAVADIVTEMAPAAKLYLYCIQDTVGFAAAERSIAATKIPIATSSLGFPGDARGDGTGSTGSAADTVRRARKAGILWIQSAGNEATDHWSGKLADANRDNFIDMNGTNDEFDQVSVEPGASGAAILQWDQWPTSSAQLALDVVGFQCSDPQCDATPTEFATPDCDTGSLCEVQSQGSAPVLGVDLPTNDSDNPQIWFVRIENGTALPSTRYDITYQGEVDPSFFSFENPARAAAGSMASPADSPYALAVGAADVGADGAPQALEDFSSRGPTLDGRTKPEITAWDGVSSPEFGRPSADDPTTGFYGTSAAAPHVAGAAALVKSANTQLDAAQVQNFLEQRANQGAPANPAVNGLGHGLLTLGATPAQTPVVPDAGSRYQPFTPERLLDTRTTTGGHHGTLGAKASLTLTVPNLPNDATAVAVNLTGTGATEATYLTAHPGGTAVPGTSNVNLSATDSTAAAFAVVSLGAGHTITVSNGSSPVNVVIDLLGYFGTVSPQGLYTPLASPVRVLDTRTTTGGHHSQLARGAHVSVNPGAPAGATAAIVNLTATGLGSGGYLSAAPSCTNAVSTLNFQKLTRANLAVVTLDNNRRFCLQNNATGALDAVVDVLGFIGASGSEYHALPSPERIVDTRTGNGGSGHGHASGPLAANTSTAFYGSNVGDVPASANALMTGVVEASTTTGAYLAAFPGTTRPGGSVSTVNFSSGRVVANAAVIGTPTSGAAAHQFGLYNNAGTTHAVVDLFGYFAPSAG